MKVEEVNSYSFEFDEEEEKLIENAKDLLKTILKVLDDHKCANIECDDYDVPNIVSRQQINDAYYMFDDLRQASSIY